MMILSTELLSALTPARFTAMEGKIDAAIYERAAGGLAMEPGASWHPPRSLHSPIQYTALRE
jgi:hypothetical protein